MATASSQRRRFALARHTALATVALGCAAWAGAADVPGNPAAPPPTSPAEAEKTADDESFGALIEAGRALWEELAPEEVREDYEFPDAAQVNTFLAALEADLDEGSFERLAAYEPDARRILALLRAHETGQVLADWLEPRLDLLVAAAGLTSPPEPVPTPGGPPTGRLPPTRPGTEPALPPSGSSGPGAAVRPPARPAQRPQLTRG